MEEKEFIEKYGNVPLNFVEIYRYRIVMKNIDEKITVSGILIQSGYINNR